MYFDIKAVILTPYRRASLVISVISVISSGLSLSAILSRNISFSIACISGIALLWFLLLDIAKAEVEPNEIEKQNWLIPLVYAVGFMLMVVFYSVNWYLLGCYGQPGTLSINTHEPDLINAIYFSVITSTTLGYGDLVPLSNAAKMLASAQALTCSIYMTAGLAVLFTKYKKSSNQ
jgi:hypothetical protein